MFFSLTRIFFFSTLVVMMCFATATAHEYWLDPIDASIGMGENVIVDIRNGEDYAGAAFPYDAAKYQSLSITNSKETKNYQGRLGDYPAIHNNSDTAGLHRVALETSENIIVYPSWNKFTNFLDYHGLNNIVDLHTDQQLPHTDIKERYYRSAKTLYQVVDGNASIKPRQSSEQKALAPTGSKFEIITLTNPYSEIKELSVQILYEGTPLASRQVEMFWKGSKLVRLTSLSDDKGIATFQLLGNGDYMFNSVHVVRPDNEGVHWESYWASITFEL